MFTGYTCLTTLCLGLCFLGRGWGRETEICIQINIDQIPLKKSILPSNQTTYNPPSPAITIAGHALFKNTLYFSAYNCHYQNQYRRGNYYVMFQSPVIKHLALVELPKTTGTCPYNPHIPMISVFGPDETPAYAVINISDIIKQVGLVKKPESAGSLRQTSYRVISPYCLFNKDLSNSIGQISYL
ncbi:hypothetical protein BDB01DRAFT_900856 [Pilobolus umbonatus]|nr:hypothetical protein BDB01DRAFT_900856 [Pilobolus umbonatus]